MKSASYYARLTLRLLQVINQKVKGMSWLADDQLLHEPFEEVEDLFVLEVLLDVLLVFKFLDLVHFIIIKTSYKFISSIKKGFWGFGEIGRAHV